MINVLLIFLALAVCFIIGIGCFAVCVNANIKDKSDNATITPEEAEKLEDALYSVAMSCKTELQLVY